MKKVILLLIIVGLGVTWTVLSWQWISDYQMLRDPKTAPAAAQKLKPESRFPLHTEYMRHEILTRVAFTERVQTASHTLMACTDIGDKRLQSIAHYNLGNFFLATKQYKSALNEYRRALELDPGNYKARYNWELLARQAQQGKKQMKGNDEGDSKKKQTKTLSEGGQPKWDRGHGW